MLPARPRRRVVDIECLEPRRLFATDFVSDAMGLGTTPFVQVNGTSFFLADNGATGRELWKSDGTAAGTVFVKELTPGPTGSEVLAMFQAGGRAVIVTFVRHHRSAEFATDYAVWSSDGTADGTEKLAEFTSAEFLVKQVGDRVAFVGMTERNFANPIPGQAETDRDLTDAKLYFTDGTANGTTLVRSFEPSWTTTGTGDELQARIVDWRAMSLSAAGDRAVISFGDRGEFWSSDGTGGGTFHLSSLDSDFWVNVQNIKEYGGRIYIPSLGRLWTTDGTNAGTSVRQFETLNIEQSVLIGSKYYVIDVVIGDSEVAKRLAVIDLNDGTLTELFQMPGEIGGKVFQMSAVGERLMFALSDAINDLFTIHVTDGTPDGTTELLSVTRPDAFVVSATTVGDSMYFLLSSGGLAEDPGELYGELGALDSWIRGVNVPGGKLELWRTDGLAANTGLVRTVWDGELDGKRVMVGVSEASGKVVIRTRVETGLTRVNQTVDHSNLAVTFDDTLYYDPSELSLAREVATVKLVNGVLRLNGSTSGDTFRVYRDSANPDDLIIEFNGNVRRLAFSDVRRIVADLQDGNDHFEIDETVGGEIRLWTSVLGGDGADRIITGTGRDTIVGGSGPDFIRARGNQDLIIAGGGRDRITGGQGDDVISAGTGEDSVIGGTGSDVLFGQSARERAFGSAWEDLEDLEDDIVLQSL